MELVYYHAFIVNNYNEHANIVNTYYVAGVFLYNFNVIY